MKLILAPMEGVVDFVMRDFLTEIGGIDRCVTEFLRVTHQLLPPSVFYRICPELKSGGKTPAGVPVSLQLLGGDAVALAENAARGAELGAPEIDLNFGCPAPLVNRHDGGAVLLQWPERVEKIVREVRRAVPAHVPVTAKMRLGFHDKSLALANADAISAGGVSRLTVHCRTKTEMYRAPAHWEWIPKIQERCGFPVVANGEIWTQEDLKSCQQLSLAEEFMIGRGALADPFLFLRLRGKEVERSRRALLLPFFERNLGAHGPAYAQARTKQMLRNFAARSPHYQALFSRQKVIVDPGLFHQSLLNF